MKNTFELLITYADYRQGFVAEIWANNTHVGEVYTDENNLKKLDIFRFESEALSLDLSDFLLILKEADERLAS